MYISLGGEAEQGLRHCNNQQGPRGRGNQWQKLHSFGEEWRPRTNKDEFRYKLIYYEIIYKSIKDKKCETKYVFEQHTAENSRFEDICYV